MDDKHNNICIVISGGSVKGFGMIGALQYIDELYHLEYIHSFVGTSIGAIISYLICIGYKPLDIIQKCIEVGIMEKMYSNIDIHNVLKNKGLLNFESIIEELEILTLLKHEHTFTFSSLFTELNKELCCVTYNFSLKKIQILHHSTTPDLPCLIGLQMSSAIPLIFNEFVYKNHTYIDGCFVDNFPIRIALELGKKNIIGITSNREYDDTLLEESSNNHTQQKYLDTNGQFLSNFIDMFTIPVFENTKRTVEKFQDRYIVVDVNIPLHIFNFNLQTSDIMTMFSKGYISCKKNIIG